MDQVLSGRSDDKISLDGLLGHVSGARRSGGRCQIGRLDKQSIHAICRAISGSQKRTGAEQTMIL